VREGDGRVGACERAHVLIGRCVCAWVQARFISEGVRCEIACPSELVSPKGEKKTVHGGDGDSERSYLPCTRALPSAEARGALGHPLPCVLRKLYSLAFDADGPLS